MRLFLKRVAWFTLATGIVLALMELFLRLSDSREFNRNNEYCYKHSYLEKHIDDITLLALGHSHIADGINPAILCEGGFNAAISGMRMSYISEIAKRYVPRMSNLKTLIIPLGYNFQYSQKNNNYQDHMMGKYWDIKLPGRPILDNLALLHETKTTPCMPAYIEHTTPCGINELYQLVDSMHNVNSSVEYYNMMKDDRFERKDFYDSSHLNEIGAIKLSEIIKNEILTLTID